MEAVILIQTLGRLYGTNITRKRQDHARSQSGDTAIKELAEQYDLNPKTVMKWKNRSFVEDMPMGPKKVHLTVLTLEEEAMCVAFRKYTLLPLDDCLYALQATLPHLTRSSLHRLFQRHGISRLPNLEDDKKKKKFKDYPIGYFHIDITEVCTKEGELYMFVAIDRTSKFTFVELHERTTRRIAADFLKALIEIVPYTIHTVLTDNGIQFTTPGNERSAARELMEMKRPVRNSAHTPLNGLVQITISIIAKPNQIIPGRMVRSSA